MKIAIVNKSDSTGGAAVVSRRLMEALRSVGTDARMVVVEKLSGSPYVEMAASNLAVKKSFISERLKIFMSNGFDRDTLFRIDTGSDGLPLWRHPVIRDADAVLLNWVNQGMLSLDGVREILETGKTVIWTMHDMWCMTGVCHHAGACNGFKGKCRECPLMAKKLADRSLTVKIQDKKRRLYSLPGKIRFVAVSNWLRDKACESELLACQDVSVIPNAFILDDRRRREPKGSGDRITMAFGAARLDDPIKGLPVLVEMTRVLRERYPSLAERMELVTFGGVRNPSSLNGIGIPHRHLGLIRGEEAVRNIYDAADIVVSSSSYETLPGTLVEAQAYGCLPVSFNRGGQSDIVDHLETGYLAEYSEDPIVASSRLAEGVAWAAGVVEDPEQIGKRREKMYDEVLRKFSPEAVAGRYLELIGKAIL